MNQENDKKESYKVLLADDEQIERMALARRLLKRFGESLVILQAVDGTEAIKLCSQEGCQIIFLTAYDEFSYAKRAIAIHALDYLLKPCEEEELTAVMEEAMRRLRRRRQFEELNRTDASAGESRQEAIEGEEFKDEADMEEPDRLGQAAEKLRRYIRKNYMRDISMQDAARMMNYSDAYFCKLFKQCFDQNFTAYLTGFRIQEARRLLQEKSVSVREVSMLVGYYDANYFAKVFKRITGMNPSGYRDSVWRQP